MKKRIMLILAFGISFTPAVFAAPGSSLADAQVHKTGEFSNLSRFGEGGINCKFNSEKGEMPVASSDSRESSAQTAR